MVYGRQSPRPRGRRGTPGATGLEALEPRTLMSVTGMGPDTVAYLPFDPTPAGMRLNPAQYTAAAAADLINLDDFRADPRFSWADGTGYAAVVLDTGIDRDHPFFGEDANHNGVADRIVYSYDFADNDSDASDHDDHGSNVSSIIGSSDPTFTGMAPAVNLIHLKVFKDDGLARDKDIKRALRWVVTNARRYNVASVNMSLGGEEFCNSFTRGPYSDELQDLADLGVTVVAAAGNDYSLSGSMRGVSYPAADPNVLAVGAVYSRSYGREGRGARATWTGPDRVTYFSQRTTGLPEVFAPGSPIAGADGDGGVYVEQGTSQAAPHVAGVAVLMQQLADRVLGRRLGIDEMRSLMMRTGERIVDGDDERDPVVNTGAAYRRLDVIAMANAIWKMAGPEVKVLLESGPGKVTALTDDVSKIAFGSTTMGTSIIKSFTVENTGTRLLKLSNLRATAGFSIAEPFALRRLRPGESTTFSVRLDGALVGAAEGSVRFTTNDRDEKRYDLAVSGSTRPIAASLDDGTSGVVTDGQWTAGTGGVGGDNRTRPADADSGTTTWNFTRLVPGVYKVFATWLPGNDLASNARFSLWDGAGHRASKMVNQRTAPDDVVVSRIGWEELATVLVAGSDLFVQLGGLANGELMADSVRIERLGTLPGGGQVFVTSGTTPIASDEGVQRFGNTASGRPVLRTFIVRNVGSGVLTLDQNLVAPEGYSIVTLPSARLAPGTSTTVTLRLDAGAPGDRTGTFVLLSDSRARAEFGINISGTVAPVVKTVDDGDATFAATGSWTVTHPGYRNDGLTAPAGSGSATAMWTFNGLVAGLFRVFVTWAGSSTADAARASNAPYSVSVGEYEPTEVRVDQRTAPTDSLSQGAWWHTLGEFRVIGTTLAVQLNNLADGLVTADAIRVERVGN